MDTNDFREKITFKPYLKYVYQPVLKGPKTAQKEAFLEAINRISLDHSYKENIFKKSGPCFFYLKKGALSIKKSRSGMILSF